MLILFYNTQTWMLLKSTDLTNANAYSVIYYSLINSFLVSV